MSRRKKSDERLVRGARLPIARAAKFRALGGKRRSAPAIAMASALVVAGASVVILTGGDPAPGDAPAEARTSGGILTLDMGSTLGLAENVDPPARASTPSASAAARLPAPSGPGLRPTMLSHDSEAEARIAQAPAATPEEPAPDRRRPDGAAGSSSPSTMPSALPSPPEAPLALMTFPARSLRRETAPGLQEASCAERHRADVPLVIALGPDAAFDRAARDRVRALAEDLVRCGELRVEVRGFASGEDGATRALVGFQRAERVALVLEAAGLAPERISLHGAGTVSADPVSDEGPSDRIELRVR